MVSCLNDSAESIEALAALAGGIAKSGTLPS